MSVLQSSTTVAAMAAKAQDELRLLVALRPTAEERRAAWLLSVGLSEISRPGGRRSPHLCSSPTYTRKTLIYFFSPSPCLPDANERQDSHRSSRVVDWDPDVTYP